MTTKAITPYQLEHQGLKAIGAQIRAQRKILRITAIATAAAAGISRVTLHRIENGEATVTAGAYSSVLQALGLEWAIQKIHAANTIETKDFQTGWIPVRIRLHDYPQLQQLAWHVQGVDTLTPTEALGIYQRNWRHINVEALTPAEQGLIDGLKQVFARDAGLV